MTLTLMDWFCGAGGSSQGAHAVPGVEVARAANHWQLAIESHTANFPQTDHWKGDIREAPVERWPVCDLFWASPECTKWSKARGKKRDFHNTQQVELFSNKTAQDEEDERSRALMDEVPQYLAGVQARGGLVLAGVVENVIDEREWDQWSRWLSDIHNLGYKTRVIALNSMHAVPVRTRLVPQSRDRLYVAYWHRSLGRDPDWAKWLRPDAWCPTCQEVISAVQVFKDPGRDMGRYGIKHGSYVYRCPRTSCRNRIVEPEALPAYVAIDWSIRGLPIGERPAGLKPKTIARIRAGLAKYARPFTAEVAGNTFERRPGVRTWPVDSPLSCQTTTATKALCVPPLLVPSGGTWRDDATSIEAPMPTRTTVETDALAIPPLLVPCEGRDGKEASPVLVPMRTQTTRNETGLAWLPYVIPLRGGGDAEKSRPVTSPVHTVTAGGNHHGLVTPPSLETVDWHSLLVPYYGKGVARHASEPVGTMTTKDRWALVQGLDDIDINDVLYRMLEPHEIGAAMGFAADYMVLGSSKRKRVRQYGGAVTPGAAEVIVSALVEAVTGEELERAA